MKCQIFYQLTYIVGVDMSKVSTPYVIAHIKKTYFYAVQVTLYITHKTLY